MNEIKLEEKGPIEAFCEIIANELLEITTHICNERYFQGAISLGSLLSSVLNRQAQEEIERFKNKEVKDEDDEEEYDYESLYKEKCNETFEIVKDLIKIREENRKNEFELNKIITLLINLYNNDHIFLDQRSNVSRGLILTNKVVESDIYSGKLMFKY